MNEDILYPAIFCILGIAGFFWGFTRLRRKRLIENIPTSTIRGAAMGLVELTGKARSDYPLKSPFEQVSCVLYKYKIEKHVSTGKNSRWITIAKGNSQNAPFYLEDDTGKVMILPRGAELFIPVSYHFKTGWGSSIPGAIESFMLNHAIRYKTLFGNHTLRFREWRIKLGEPTYVLGTAKQTKNIYEEKRRSLQKRLDEIKNNPKKMAEIDLNRDGKISDEEWQIAVDKAEQEIIEGQLQQSSTKNEEGVVITQGETEKMFMISNHSQKDLVNKLFWQSLLGIYGGALLTVVTGWCLVNYFVAH